MACPRCGLEDASGPSCPRCGIVFSKYRDPAARPAPRSRTGPPPTPSGGSSLAVWLLPLALLCVAAWLLGRALAPGPSEAPRASGAVPAPERETRAPESPGENLPPQLPAALPPLELPSQLPSTAGLSASDQRLAQDLARRIGDRGAVFGEGDLRAVRELCDRHPDEDGLRTLRAAVHLRLAMQDQAARRYPSAQAHVKLAAAEPALAADAQAVLAGIDLEIGDFTGAEAAARRWLELRPGDVDAQRSLALALFRQDRNREAAQVLEALLELREDPQARALLGRLRKTASDEQGMTEQRLAHFNVRYDGDAHEDVGREILRALEHHYATLRVTLDHEVSVSVPVILFSSESYYQANGMPAWAGGHFDHIDGRIRIPIGGLTTSLSPDLDGTLIHELTHAFVADRSRGVAPREVHEGLAQYLEGKRVDQESPALLTALSQGRVPGVGGFYLEALAFVEDLQRLRGQGGVNDLLRAMGESGSVDEAFRQVYGRDFAGARADFRQRFQRQQGG